jgi:N-acylneuraminate cytidylyltransferase/CMP-N,N'-diacetyllegionaminic acid synthase
MVSTDNTRIAGVAKRYGADVPFIRPKELATDRSRMIDVILHAVDFLEKRGRRYDVVLLLQPTSPLRTASDIDDSIELLFRKRAQAVVAMSQASHRWTNTLPKNGCMEHFLDPNRINKNRQELPARYFINGAIYLALCAYLKKHKQFYGGRTYAYHMPVERSVDIDDIFDFRFAEFLLKAHKKEKNAR